MNRHMSESDAEIETPPKRPPREPRRERHVRWTTILSLSVALLVFFVLALALTDRTLPVPNFVRAKLENRINGQFEGSPLALGPMEIGVSRKGIPQIFMNNLRIADATGTAAAQLNWLGAELSLERLVKGEFAASSVFLSGAQVTIRRTADGDFLLASGAQDNREADNISDLLAGIDSVMATGTMAPLTEVIAGGVVITLEDARSGRIWQATNASGNLKKTSDALTLSVTSDVFNGTDNLAGIQVSLTRNRATGNVSAGFSLSDMPAADIALQSPVLAWLGVLDAPISGSVRTEIDKHGALVSFAGTFDIDAGALQPTDTVKPLAFKTAKAYFTFDPARQRIDFSQVSLGAEDGRLVATGHTYLSDFDGLWPRAYLGQFRVEQLDYSGGETFEGPVSLSDISADIRLRLDPFTVELAQLAIDNDGVPIVGKGRVVADEIGWHAALDATTERISSDRVLAFWPVQVSPITRGWLSRNLQKGSLLRPAVGVRFDTESEPDISFSFEFEDGIARFLPEMPLLTQAGGRAAMHDKRFSLSVTDGGVTASTGQRIDASGSRFTVADVRPKPAWGQIDVVAKGPLQGALSILNNPPLRIMERAKRPSDLASAEANAKATITLPLMDGIRNEDVSYKVSADLTRVSSDKLVEGRVFASSGLRLTATSAEIGLVGPATLDGVPLTARWQQPLGDAADQGGRITGQVTLSQEAVTAFDLPLPEDMLSGKGSADYVLTLPSGDAPPTLELSSDLSGLTLGLGSIGWRKASSQTGKLDVLATLGDTPQINALTLDAPGLSLNGQLDLDETGGLKVANLQNVRVGGWLDANVQLTPDPAGRSPVVSVTGGTLDLRQIDLGGGGGSARGSPINLKLDRLTVSDGIAFAPLSGRITPERGGLSGNFEALVNGRTPVSGTLAPANAGTAIRIRSANAGGVLRDAGLTPNAREGTLDLVLTPTSRAPSGTFDGEFLIEDIRMKDAPALANLLDAVSVVGLIGQLSGPGIRFDTIDGQFRLDRRQITLRQAAAVGTSMGISADGIYDLRTDRMDFRGVISPVYFLNGIGSLLTRRGEGLFGFNYRMSGPAADPKVGVNPLSILTPGAFRQIFRRAPPGG